MKALLNFSKDLNELNFYALNRYMTYLWCPGKETPIKSVYKLAPGEALLVKKVKLLNLGHGILHHIKRIILKSLLAKNLQLKKRLIFFVEQLIGR